MSNYTFVTTTNAQYIPANAPVIMVDGTVPGYEFKDEDLLFDHHKKGGSDIQLEDMAEYLDGLQSWKNLDEDTIFVTTMTDADACVAAASIILANEGISPWGPTGWWKKFSAIAFDCDHLAVPAWLEVYQDFAAKAVAAMKQEGFKLADKLGLPSNRREWTDEQRLEYASATFREGTLWLVAAAKYERPYPGESGEADDYFQNMEHQVSMYNDRVSEVMMHGHGYLLFDFKGVNDYVDPRVPLRIAANKWGSLQQFQPQTITVRDRQDGKGLSYTIGCIPLHHGLDGLDYTRRVFAALTQAERVKDPEWDANGNGWGGRKTVGGSSWNTGSLLEPHEVVEVIYHNG